MRFRSLLVAAVAGAALAAPAAAFAADNPYGTQSPTGVSGAPGGFTSVVTTKTVGATGGTLSGDVAGGVVSVNVPSGAFTGPVQLVVTAPVLADAEKALPSVGFSGFKAVGGFGIKVNQGGVPYAGTFKKPVTVTLAGSFGTGAQVLEFTGAKSAKAITSKAVAGGIQVAIDQDPNLLVVAPVAGKTPVVDGATNTKTGVPFALETSAGAALVLAGGAGVLVARRRRGEA